MTITKKPCVIYALCEPDGNFTVRYVGKTEAGMDVRYKAHINPCYLKEMTHKNNWIKNLLSAGQQPVMIEIESLPPGSDWAARERYWISYYRELGYVMTNATDGGDGISGYRHSEQARAVISASQVGNTKNLGKKRSAESNRRRSESQRGRRPSAATMAAAFTPEAIAKRAASRRGQKRSPETCARISAGSKGHTNRLGIPHSDETREKLRQANLGKQHTPETRAKMSETRRRKAELKRLAILFALLAESKEAS